MTDLTPVPPKRVIYTASPFRSPLGPWGIFLNVRHAEKMALEVWKRGAVALCPHLNTANFQGALPDSVWLEGDLELLDRSDALLLSGEWNKSEGCQMELRHAQAKGIPVLISLEDLDRFLGREPEKPAPTKPTD